MARRSRKFTPYRPPAPPAGSYDPSLDSQLAAARRGLSDLTGQLGTQQARDVTDYATAQQQAGQAGQNQQDDLLKQFRWNTQDLVQARDRGSEDYNRNVQMLTKQYQNLGQSQLQGANNAGVLRGGAMLQAAAKRTANEATDRQPLDTNYNRFIADNQMQFLRSQDQYATQAGRGAADTTQRLGQLALDYSPPDANNPLGGRRYQDRTTQLTQAQREQAFFGQDVGAQKAYQAAGTGWDPPQRPANEFVSKTGTPYRVQGGVRYDQFGLAARPRDRERVLMAKKSRRSRFADDAALQSIVRFGPEESGLKALAQQARADYGVSVRQAQTTGDLTMQAAREAIPSVSRIYDQAGLDQAKTASLVSPELAALSGPGAGILQRGGALEVAQQLGNLRASKASALEDLNTRAVAARQGQQYATIQARTKYTNDIAKILGQTQSLNQQKGAFAASTINALEEAARGRAVTKRGQDKTLEASKASTKESARGHTLSHEDRLKKIEADAGKLKGTTLPGGVKLNTPAQHGAVADQVASLEGLIKEHKGDYKSRRELAADLLNGVPASTVVDPKTGAKLRDPGIPKAPSQLALQAALDVVYNGGLSRGTAAALHQRGYSVKVLGLPSGTKIKPPPKRSRKAAALIPAAGRRGF